MYFKENVLFNHTLSELRRFPSIIFSHLKSTAFLSTIQRNRYPEVTPCNDFMRNGLVFISVLQICFHFSLLIRFFICSRRNIHEIESNLKKRLISELSIFSDASVLAKIYYTPFQNDMIFWKCYKWLLARSCLVFKAPSVLKHVVAAILTGGGSITLSIEPTEFHVLETTKSLRKLALHL